MSGESEKDLVEQVVRPIIAALESGFAMLAEVIQKIGELPSGDGEKTLSDVQWPFGPPKEPEK